MERPITRCLRHHELNVITGSAAFSFKEMLTYQKLTISTLMVTYVDNIWFSNLVTALPPLWTSCYFCIQAKYLLKRNIVSAYRGTS
jgi:hypothetical protein